MFPRPRARASNRLSGIGCGSTAWRCVRLMDGMDVCLCRWRWASRPRPLSIGESLLVLWVFGETILKMPPEIRRSPCAAEGEEKRDNPSPVIVQYLFRTHSDLRHYTAGSSIQASEIFHENWLICACKVFCRKPIIIIGFSTYPIYGAAATDDQLYIGRTITLGTLSGLLSGFFGFCL